MIEREQIHIRYVRMYVYSSVQVRLIVQQYLVVSIMIRY